MADEVINHGSADKGGYLLFTTPFSILFISTVRLIWVGNIDCTLVLKPILHHINAHCYRWELSISDLPQFGGDENKHSGLGMIIQQSDGKIVEWCNGAG